MKVLFVFAAIFGLSLAAPSPFGLDDDLGDILSPIDIDAVDSIIRTNAESNGDLIDIVLWAQGDDLETIKAYLQEQPRWIELKEWLADKNVPIEDYLALLSVWGDSIETGEGSGDTDIHTFFAELVAVLNLDEVLAIALEKLVTSQEVRDLVDLIKDEKTHDLFDGLLGVAELQKFLADLRDNKGVDIEGILLAAYTILGWGEPPAIPRKF